MNNMTLSLFSAILIGLGATPWHISPHEVPTYGDDSSPHSFV
jgi:hypothetical protein